MRPLILVVAVALLLPPLLASCSESSAVGVDASGTAADGAPASDGGMDAAGLGPLPLASLDEPCDGTALTGTDVLALIQQSYDTTLVWTFSEASTSLKITVAYEGGAIRCHRAITPMAGSAAPKTLARVDVEVRVTFETGDGSLVEAFDARLEASAEDELHEARLIHKLPADQVAGTFDPALPDLTDVAVSFSATFIQSNTEGFKTDGRVSANGTTSAGGRELHKVAQWPATTATP